MPTIHNDQFFSVDPFAPPAAGTLLTAGNFNFTDENDDGLIGPGVGDTFNGLTIFRVFNGDTITVNLAAPGDPDDIVTIIGVTFYVTGGDPVFTPTDGTVLQNATFVSSTSVPAASNVAVASLAPICFTPGTMIATPGGPRLIETLIEGDLVLTLDHGPQKLRLISRDRFTATGRNAPVRIRKGALGNDADLLVSQQHRFLISDWRAALYFGEDEVLVAAKHLSNADTIYVQPGGEVDYIHLLFDRHEIIWAAGIPTESYFPGHFADQEAQAELDRLFPHLNDVNTDDWRVARPVVRHYEGMLLA